MAFDRGTEIFLAVVDRQADNDFVCTHLARLDYTSAVDSADSAARSPLMKLSSVHM